MAEIERSRRKRSGAGGESGGSAAGTYDAAPEPVGDQDPDEDEPPQVVAA